MRSRLFSAVQQTGPFTLHSWAEPANTEMQDALAVAVFDDRVRIAAIDGCTPMRQTPTVAGVNGATYAAHLLAGAMLSDRPVADILRECNEHLVELGADVTPCARPQACVAVAEVITRADGLYVRCWAAGDAQLWVRQATGWALVAGGGSTAPETRARWRPQREALRAAGMSFDELQQAEAEYFADRTLYVNHTPIGRFQDLGVQAVDTTGVAVTAATDGALLNPAALDHLETWIAGLRDVERAGVDRLKATDDLAVIRLVAS